MRMLLKIASAMGIGLLNERDFYRELSSKVGDVDCAFIEDCKNTQQNNIISVEDRLDEGIFLHVGSNIFKNFENLHEAVWYFIVMHEIFKVKFDDRACNLAALFCTLNRWPFGPKPSKLVKSIIERIWYCRIIFFIIINENYCFCIY